MNENQIERKIPLGLYKQAFMKLESFLTDIQEIRESTADLDADQSYTLYSMADMSSTMMAMIINIINREIGEEEFINEQIEMDEIDDFPERYHYQDDDVIDLFNESID